VEASLGIKLEADPAAAGQALFTQAVIAPSQNLLGARVRAEAEKTETGFIGTDERG